MCPGFARGCVNVEMKRIVGTLFAFVKTAVTNNLKTPPYTSHLTPYTCYPYIFTWPPVEPGHIYTFSHCADGALFALNPLYLNKPAPSVLVMCRPVSFAGHALPGHTLYPVCLRRTGDFTENTDWNRIISLKRRLHASSTTFDHRFGIDTWRRRADDPSI